MSLSRTSLDKLAEEVLAVFRLLKLMVYLFVSVLALNVSVIGGIILYHLSNQSGTQEKPLSISPAAPRPPPLHHP